MINSTYFHWHLGSGDCSRQPLSFETSLQFPQVLPHHTLAMKKASDVRGLGYNRIVPKFLQSYSHMLGGGTKNQYSETHQLDHEDAVFSSLEQIEADGAVVVEKSEIKRKRALEEQEGVEGADDAPTVVVEESTARKIVDSSERFSSQRRSAAQAEHEQQEEQQSSSKPSAGDDEIEEESKPATSGPVLFRPRKLASTSTDGDKTTTAAADKKVAKKQKKLLSFDAEEEA